jgi:hypothetical protein
MWLTKLYSRVVQKVRRAIEMWKNVLRDVLFLSCLGRSRRVEEVEDVVGTRIARHCRH